MKERVISKEGTAINISLSNQSCCSKANLLKEGLLCKMFNFNAGAGGLCIIFFWTKFLI